MLHQPASRHCTPHSVQAGARCALALRHTSSGPALRRCLPVCAAALPKQQHWRQTHKPLMGLFVEHTIQYVADTTGQHITHEEALSCLQEPQLLAMNHPYPGLFHHLYKTFRHRKVRVAIGDSIVIDQSKGISYVDPRCPANIQHPDHTAVSAGMPDATAPRISSATAVERHGYKLVHPKLLCVGFLTWPGRPEAELCYATWPLECCWYHPDRKVVKDARDDGWPDVSQQLYSGNQSSAATNPMHMPEFVLRACLKQGLIQPSPQAVTDPKPTASGVLLPPGQARGRLLSTLDARSLASRGSAPASSAADGPAESSGDSSSAASASSSCSSAAPAVASKSASDTGRAFRSSNGTALAQLSLGFKDFTIGLAPTKHENLCVSTVVSVLRKVLQDIHKDQVWSVKEVLTVGSTRKRTGLRASGSLPKQDLDIQIVIHAQCFKLARSQCFAHLHQVLCQPTVAASSTVLLASAVSGWELECSLPHCLKLKHPVLNLRMDVQACEHLSVFGGKWRQRVLEHLLMRAHAAQARIEPPPSPSPSVEAVTDPDGADRDRTALLTDLMTDVLKGIQDRFERDYGLTCAGAMVTSVIRAVKSWVQACGLEGLLLPHNRSSSSSGRADSYDSVGSSSNADREARKYPSGYIWEVFVVFVLESRLQHCKENRLPRPYSPGRVGQFLLFKDVLLEMSQRLRPVSVADSAALAPIALTHLYTAEQLELFRPCWGVGEISTPYIIHPADPSFNCRAFTSFMHWNVLADVAGELHQRLEQLLQQEGTGFDAWETALKETTLGCAVRAFADDAS